MTKNDLLTAHQAQTLEAAVNRIILADDYPGGWDAGVGEYFARLFARERRFLPLYQQGLDSLETEARTAWGMSFADLDAKQQDDLLTRIEAGTVRDAWPQDPSSFFRLLVEQTMEGFYADPGNGGNKDSIAWKMIGYRVTG